MVYTMVFVGFEYCLSSGERMRFIVAILVVLLILLQYKLFFAHSGIRETIYLKHAVAEQTRENAKWYKSNMALANRIEALKHDKRSIEALAREDLGMIKQDETYYQLYRGEKNENLGK
jgi:cell division protein FtsB